MNGCTVHACCDEQRRAAVLGNPTLNGIDFLEVLDHDAPLGSPRQRTLLVHCLKPVPATLASSNVLVTGGESITSIAVTWVAPAAPSPPLATAAEKAYLAGIANPARVLVVRTDAYGDFAPYVLRLVNDATVAATADFDVTEPLDGFDPQLACVAFSFKVECGPDFDCKPVATDCPPGLPPPPPINYLAKDYGSLRTIVLDRLSQLVPTWEGASEADVGVMLAELLAYAGDELSYRQDAVATEAYLGTARSRVSLRRHAKLVDYTIHDGCNARAWVALNVNASFVLQRGAARFHTSSPSGPTVSLAFGAGNEHAALLAGIVAFEPMQDAALWLEHNQLRFHTWGNHNCCLPRGATEATLLGTLAHLQPGEVLVFQEVLGPQTGFAADADLRHRCVVRLTRVATLDASGQTLVDPLFEAGTGQPITAAGQKPTPVTEIAWNDEDALPFALCLSSSFLDANGTVQSLVDVSVAFGNVVLADQGLSMPASQLEPAIPSPTLVRAPVQVDRCNPTAPARFPVRYRPTLPEAPVTQAQPLPLIGAPVTPSPVALSATGSVALVDGQGNAGLLVKAKAPVAWPPLFGILAAANADVPTNLDLSVVFDPPGGPAGVAGPVVLEVLPDLTLAANQPDSAPLAIDAQSRFVRVSPTSLLPAANPANFPAAPTMLPVAGAFSLVDGGNVPYLDLQVQPALGWPARFQVLVEGHLDAPDTFDLLVLYNPGSGGVGVALPRVVERFAGLTLATIAAAGGVPSALIEVRSFEGQPPLAQSAMALTRTDARAALPEITLSTAAAGPTWTPVSDLLESGPDDAGFVVEVESDGTAKLRFGDGVNGRAPDAGTQFNALCRVGNGSGGNVGADSLVNVVADPRIVSATNPLAAVGGVDAETADQIRRRAPQAFLTQERAVSMADYAQVAESVAGIVDAEATLRWTGSWYTAFVVAEPASGGALATATRRALARRIDRARLAGEDFELEGPDYVPLEIELTVCVAPDAFQAQVRTALAAALGSGRMPDGTPGYFAPGRFRLGQTVYLSPLYAVARGVAGVASVRATVFQPQGVATLVPLRRGEIPLRPSQIARMDNDRSLPNHGRLRLVMVGGK
ncbi:putative baseplate assembly protein [Variovorax sp. dw_954]|uniref:putative baseplate assembly protein n=1 Tax=Variovorax sp. dw_954 TaxID=2720078 RepID=UPI001BD49D36|nr:putative baseplate assembly protein [Variovorax sp. dw_954]